MPHLLRARLSLLALMTTLIAWLTISTTFHGVKLSFFSDYLLDFLLLYPPFPSLHIFADIYPRRLTRDAVKFDSASKKSEGPACYYHERDPAVFARLSIRRFTSGVTSRNVSPFTSPFLCVFFPIPSIYRATPPPLLSLSHLFSMLIVSHSAFLFYSCV